MRFTKSRRALQKQDDSDSAPHCAYGKARTAELQGSIPKSSSKKHRDIGFDCFCAAEGILLTIISSERTSDKRLR